MTKAVVICSTAFVISISVSSTSNSQMQNTLLISASTCKLVDRASKKKTFNEFNDLGY